MSDPTTVIVNEYMQQISGDFAEKQCDLSPTTGNGSSKTYTQRETSSPDGSIISTTTPPNEARVEPEPGLYVPPYRRRAIIDNPSGGDETKTVKVKEDETNKGNNPFTYGLVPFRPFANLCSRFHRLQTELPPQKHECGKGCRKRQDNWWRYQMPIAYYPSNYLDKWHLKDDFKIWRGIDIKVDDNSV